METADRLRILESTLERTQAHIAWADAKSGFVLAGDTAMLAALAALMPPISSLTTHVGIVAACALALLLASLVSLFVSAWPRLAGPPDSLIFFGSISRIPGEAYEANVAKLSEEAYLHDLARQVHRNSEIAAAKYLWVQVAVLSVLAGVVPTIVAGYLLYQCKP